jgi:sugar phosphate isomerase/epimerase
VTVTFYRSLWGPLGFDGDISNLPSICEETVRRGYGGVETNPLFLGKDPEPARQIIADHGLGLLARAHTLGATVADHLAWVQRCVERAVLFGSPHVIVQSGADWFTDEQIDEYFTGVDKIEADAGLRLAHETHRSCILYSPRETTRVLDRFPDLWLAADYSHWVIVTESLLEMAGPVLERCAPRTLHIDARVGTAEMPQVADPRTAAETAAFDGFWDQIHAANPDVTVVPEFGPPPYEPVGAADRDDICEWMVGHLRDRWQI